MKQRVLGPVRGYYVAVVALRHGDMGTAFLGSFKLFKSEPGNYFQAGALHEGSSSSPSPRRDAALEAAEDLAFDAVAALPELSTSGLPPQPPLHALMYVSTAIDDLAPEHIARLLVAARKRNRSLGVTGILLFFDGTFMQYIEGGLPQLELIYRIIRKDPMHTGLIELMHTRVARRAFQDWTMAFDAHDAGRWVGNDVHPLIELPAELTDFARVPLALFLKRHFEPSAPATV